MKFTPFLITLLLFGFIQFIGVDSGTKWEDSPKGTHTGYEIPGKVQFALRGFTGAEDYVAVHDTLAWHFEKYGPKGPEGSMEWGLDFWCPDSESGLQAQNGTDNLRLWAELDFTDRTDAFAWIEQLKESPYFQISFNKNEENLHEGVLTATLPVPGEAGKELLLSEFDFNLIAG